MYTIVYVPKGQMKPWRVNAYDDKHNAEVDLPGYVRDRAINQFEPSRARVNSWCIVRESKNEYGEVCP